MVLAGGGGVTIKKGARTPTVGKTAPRVLHISPPKAFSLLSIAPPSLFIAIFFFYFRQVQMRDLFVENDGMDGLRGEVHLWCLKR